MSFYPISICTKSTFVTLETPKKVRRSMTFDYDMLRHTERPASPLIPVFWNSKRSCSPSSVSSCSPSSDSESKRVRVVANENCFDDDEKTTVVIKNVPHKYTQEWLLEEILSLGFNADFFYLPRRNFAKPNNIGYGFVNFSSAAEAKEFMRTFSGRKFPRQPNSMKRAEVMYAKLQGKQSNVDHYSDRAQQGAICFWSS